MAKVALIAGGNGITGSAIIEHLAKNTNEQQWTQIIVTSRSALILTFEDPRIKFLPLDLTDDRDKLVEAMRVPCVSVTHAYFAAYVHSDDFVQLNAINKGLFETFLDVLIEVAPKLENCTLQTGGKYYNVHALPGPSPLYEDHPRGSKPEENFYYPQEDYLAEKQKGQKWTWNVVRPDGVIGATNKPNGMNLALTMAAYFVVCKELGQEARMPTNQIYWRGTEDCCDSRLLADMTVWASTNPSCANQAFNASNGDVVSWGTLWPKLAALIGAPPCYDQKFSMPTPQEGELQQEFSLVEWASDKRPVWDALCDKAGKPHAKATFDTVTWFIVDWTCRRTWAQVLSLSKARALGWTGYKDSYQVFADVFQRYKDLGQIP